MAKIKFEHAEKNMGDAMHYWFIKKISSGKSSAYPRAAAYLGMGQTKPGPEDSVIGAINEWREDLLDEALEREEELQQKEEETEELPREEIEIQKEEIQEPEAVTEEIHLEETPTPMVSPMYILRKRILWFIRKRVTNIYELLGTTKEEVVALRKKKDKTPEDEKKIQELLDKSHEINERLLQRLGIKTDDDLIEKEKQLPYESMDLKECEQLAEKLLENLDHDSILEVRDMLHKLKESYLSKKIASLEMQLMKEEFPESMEQSIEPLTLTLQTIPEYNRIWHKR